MLCDCPGLVFPSTVTTKEELVLAGILPVNHIRDWLSPVGLLVNLIPK
jgi:large subunit GTPase 1